MRGVKWTRLLADGRYTDDILDNFKRLEFLNCKINFRPPRFAIHELHNPTLCPSANELGPISKRYLRPSCAIMMNANGRGRLAGEDEAVPLLTPDDSEPSRTPSNSTRRPVWLQCLLCVYYAARRTAPQLISINVLWIFVPLGLTSGALHWNSILTSIFNFLAIIPLSAAVSDASDKLSDAFGDLLGALINATFGNAVELIVILHVLSEFS